jgi:hypothetical protein
VSEIAMIARCTICNKPFAGPMFSKVGLGMDAVNNRLAVFTEKLTRHLFEEHREVAQEIQLQGTEYQGYLFLSKFSSSDPNLAMQLDVARWKVHQNTLAVRVTDQQITDAIEKFLPDILTLAEMRDTATLKRNLTGLMQSMRDQLEEPGKYTFSPFSESLSGKAS